MVAGNAKQWWAQRKVLGWAVVVLLLAALLLWRGGVQQAQSEMPLQEQTDSRRDFFVEARTFHAEPYQASVVLQGKLAPLHSVNLRAQVPGMIEARPKLGQRVAKDDALIALSDEGRSAQLAQAQADLALRQAEASAGRKLRAQQHISQSQLLSLNAAAATAKAGLANAQLALRHSQITAPFSGHVDKVPVEQGDVVQVGDELLTLVDVSALRLKAVVSQQEVSKLSLGLPVRAVLLDGRELNGELDFIAQAADDQTRSFALEAKLANPQGWRVAGASVGLHIQLAERPAIRLSPALLALDKHSDVGVSVLDEDDRMHWQPIQLLSITPDTAWVSGLPKQVRLVSRGADFVKPNTILKVRMADEHKIEESAVEEDAAEVTEQATDAHTDTPLVLPENGGESTP